MKTSKADFEYFKRRYLYHLREVGIGSFEVRFLHTDVDDAYATTEASTEGRDVRVTLSTDWANGDGRKVSRRALDFSARHEVYHLLLCRLVELAEMAFSKNLVGEAEEEVIRTLENYLDRVKR